MSATDASTAANRILVVSKDARIRERFYDALTGRDWRVTTAVTCENALEVLQIGQSFGLIFLDGSFAQSKLAQFLDRVRYFDEALAVILLQRRAADDPGPASAQNIQACLPADADDAAMHSAVSRWLPAQRSVRPIRYPGAILLVDDEPELLQSLRTFLTSRECTVLTAASGEEALARVAKDRPSLVFLDIKMPGMDGLLTLKKLRAVQPHLPVIMATAVADEASLSQAAALGAHDYILKPYNLTVLEAMLFDMKARAVLPTSQ